MLCLLKLVSLIEYILVCKYVNTKECVTNLNFFRSKLISEALVYFKLIAIYFSSQINFIQFEGQNQPNLPFEFKDYSCFVHHF